MSKRIRRSLLALLAGFAVFGLFASAASLGGVTSARVGADQTVVASCDTDGVTLGYTTQYSASAGYTVSAVSVTGIAAACNGQTLSLTLSGTGGAALASGTASVSGTSASIALATPPAAASVTGAAVVIAG